MPDIFAPKLSLPLWTSSSRCFIPSKNYFTPDTSTRWYSRNGEDSLTFREFTKQSINITYSHLNNLLCAEKVSADVYYLNDHILELHYFTGVFSGQMKMGYTEVLRFTVNHAGKADLLLIGGIHHN